MKSRALGRGHAPDKGRPVVLFGRRMSRDGAIYFLSLVFVFPVSLVNAVVLTHLLTPGEYGDLGILLIFAGFLTILEGLVTQIGLFAYVYGGGGGDEDVGDDEQQAESADKRRAMTTGFVLLLVFVGVASVPLIVFSGTVATWLIGRADAGTAIVWALFSAAAGAVWRVWVNLLRYERRTVAFAVVSCARPLLVLAVSVPLVAAGWGVNGALIGTGIGTLLAAAVCPLIGPPVLSWSVSRSDAKQIARLGIPRAPVVLSLWTLHNADLFFLSRFGTAPSLGFYRLASRFGSVPSYFTSAWLMALGPLRRSSVFKAAAGAHPAVMKSRMFSYFIVLTLGIVLALGVSADILIEVAPAAYGDAAPLIPMIGMSFLCYGAFIMLHRIGRIRKKQRVYGWSAVGACLLMGALSAVLIPPLGAYGAALSVILSLLGAAAVLIFFISRGREPIPFAWRRIVLAGVLAGAGYSIYVVATGLTGVPAGLTAIVALSLYPVGLVMLDVVPRSELRPLAQASAGSLPSKRSSRPALRAALSALPSGDRSLIESLLRPRATTSSQSPPPEARGLRHARGAAVLRRMEGLKPCPEADEQLGRYLFAHGWRAELDQHEQALWEGVDPLVIHRLELLVEALRRLPPKDWEASSDA